MYPAMTSAVYTAYEHSIYPLPELPRIKTMRLWDELFTHESLPNSNAVLALLGEGILSACVAEWLIDADPGLTHEELQLRSKERINTPLLSAFGDVYALPPLLQYAKSYPAAKTLSIKDVGTVFLAYIGAVHKDHGYEVTKDWIFALMDWDNLTMLQSLQRD